MDKRQVEIEKLMLDYEKQCVKDLQKTYTEALADVKLKLRSLLGRDQTLSVVYQIEFQRTLEAQLQSAVDTLKSGSITSVTDFLNKTYEDGYLGTIYSIQGQGIPINIGVDHKQLARVVNRKTDSFRFSDRLYKNVDELAVAFKSEMTRGIANDSGYSMIARQLSLVSEASYKRALTIVRTEGGRVKSEAKLDSMKAAKDEGADIVKQWDATFDGKTRPEHRFLDGQIREIDEPFTDSQGRQAQAPHKFGVASMDINCRCIVVERARWAVEGEEIPNKVHNHTGELVEADDYKEWKEKAQRQLNEKKEKAFNKRKEELEKNGVKVFDKNTKNVPKKGDYFQTASKELVEIVEISDYNGIKTATLANGETVVLKNAKEAKPVDAFTPAKTITEAQDYATKFGKRVNYSGASNIDNVNAVNEQLKHLTDEYPIERVGDIKTNGRLKRANAQACYDLLDINTDYLNNPPEAYDWINQRQKNLTDYKAGLERAEGWNNTSLIKSYKKAIKGIEEDLKFSRWSVSSSLSKEKALRATISHEYGHIISDQKTGLINRKRACPSLEFVKGNKAWDLQNLINDTFNTAKKNGDIYKISRYAGTNSHEFFSETFAMYDLGEDLPDYIADMIRKVVE